MNPYDFIRANFDFFVASITKPSLFNQWLEIVGEPSDLTAINEINDKLALTFENNTTKLIDYLQAIHRSAEQLKNIYYPELDEYLQINMSRLSNITKKYKFNTGSDHDLQLGFKQLEAQKQYGGITSAVTPPYQDPRARLAILRDIKILYNKILHLFHTYRNLCQSHNPEYVLTVLTDYISKNASDANGLSNIFDGFKAALTTHDHALALSLLHIKICKPLITCIYLKTIDTNMHPYNPLIDYVTTTVTTYHHSTTKTLLPYSIFKHGTRTLVKTLSLCHLEKFATQDQHNPLHAANQQTLPAKKTNRFFERIVAKPNANPAKTQLLTNT